MGNQRPTRLVDQIRGRAGHARTNNPTATTTTSPPEAESFTPHHGPTTRTSPRPDTRGRAQRKKSPQRSCSVLAGQVPLTRVPAQAQAARAESRVSQREPPAACACAGTLVQARRVPGKDRTRPHPTTDNKPQRRAGTTAPISSVRSRRPPEAPVACEPDIGRNQEPTERAPHPAARVEDDEEGRTHRPRSKAPWANNKPNHKRPQQR